MSGVTVAQPGAATETVTGTVRKGVAVADPAGGATVDTEARAQLVALLESLRTADTITT